MAIFNLPRLKSNLPIVNGQGKPTDFFLRLFNIDFAQRLELVINDQQALIDQIIAAQAAADAAQATADAALAAAGDASGAKYANLNANAPAIIASVSVTNVTAGTRLSVDGILTGGDLDADAQYDGVATLSEFDGITLLTLATIPFTVQSSGLEFVPGEWQAEDSTPIQGSAVGTYTGTVTYQLTFARTGGSNYVNGPDIRSIITITPEAA